MTEQEIDEEVIKLLKLLPKKHQQMIFDIVKDMADENDRITGLKELIKVQSEYLNFLNEEYKKVFDIAYIHHYRTSDEVYQRGKELRNKIDELNELYNRQ